MMNVGCGCGLVGLEAPDDHRSVSFPHPTLLLRDSSRPCEKLILSSYPSYIPGREGTYRISCKYHSTGQACHVHC